MDFAESSSRGKSSTRVSTLDYLSTEPNRHSVFTRASRAGKSRREDYPSIAQARSRDKTSHRVPLAYTPARTRIPDAKTNARTFSSELSTVASPRTPAASRPRFGRLNQFRRPFGHFGVRRKLSGDFLPFGNKVVQKSARAFVTSGSGRTPLRLRSARKSERCASARTFTCGCVT